MLHDIRDVGQTHPDDIGVSQRAAEVKAIYEEAKGFSDSDARKRSAPQALLRRGSQSVVPTQRTRTPQQRTLCQRVERFIRELFVFMAEPYVPSDNNAAERSLRPQDQRWYLLRPRLRLDYGPCIPLRHMER